LELRTPRGAFVRELDLSSKDPFAKVLLFGFERDGLVIYEKVTLLSTNTHQQLEFVLSEAAGTKGPFSQLQIRY
jgi:hypothetical protein